MTGFTFTSLSERGLGCDHAKHLALHFLRHGTPRGYSCTSHISGRNVHAHCTAGGTTHRRTVRAFATTYHVH